MSFTKNELSSCVRGCLIGGAVGDALGAPLEGLWSDAIPAADDLLADFAILEGYPRGQYTDDTQLTVATVRSVVRERGVQPAAIARAIARLWRTQAVVGPGGACTRAADRFLRDGDWGTCGAPIGQAGNGTAMRTAALGLLYLDGSQLITDEVADVSRITHHDPRSIAGGVAIALAARLVACGAPVDPGDFCNRIATGIVSYAPSFSRLVNELPGWLSLEESRVTPLIASAGMERPEFPKPIITPFVVPTVLAVLWTLLRNLDSWERGVAAAIGLGGDVDTLGAIVGGLLGARLGLEAIPPRLATRVRHAHKLQALADEYCELIWERLAASIH
jgi:ADP-ribosylglycohydrolase